MEAERAKPEGAAVVYASVGVKRAAAAGAEEGGVREEREVGEWRKRRAHHTEGDDEGSGIALRRRPSVPRPAEALDRLQLSEVHGVAGRGGGRIRGG